MSKGTKFCNDMGYDMMPIRMVNVISCASEQEETADTPEPQPLNWVKTEITLSEDSGADEKGYEANSDVMDN